MKKKLAFLFAGALSWMGMLWLGFPPIPKTNAQEPAVETAAKAQPKDALQVYFDLKRKIAEGKATITDLLLTTPTVDRTLQQEALVKIEAIKKNLAEWQTQLNECAVDAYCVAPDQHREITLEVTKKLRGWMGDDVVGGNFQPDTVLKSCEKILAAGAQNPIFLITAAQAAFALQDFDKCAQFLETMKSRGFETNEEYVASVKLAKESWAAEQLIRAKEANVNLPKVLLETTVGNIVIELFEDQAPHAVNNFVRLTEDGFWKDTTFFFVKSGQVAIGGCPKGDGTGNAGFYLPDEWGKADARGHFVGSLSLVHDQKLKDSSQFAISFQPNPERNGKFTVFGRVIEGMDFVYKIPNFNPQMRHSKIEPVKITSAKVIQKRDHLYEVIEKIEINPTDNTAPSGEKKSGGE